MRSKSIFISICLIALYALCGCKNTEESIEYNAIGTIESQNSIIFDNDTIIANVISTMPTEYKVGDRIIVYFTIPIKSSGNSIDIEISRIQKISTSPITTINDYETDTTYNDPIIDIKRMWVSKNHLTIDFNYNAYDTSLHHFQLALKKIENTSPDSIKLNFRHDAGSDEKGNKVRVLRSFNLSDIKPFERDTVIISVKTLFYAADTTTYKTQTFKIIDTH